MGEKTTVTCLNNVREEVFVKPLTTLDLQQNPKVSHITCPYCLKEITISENERSDSPEETCSDVETFDEKGDRSNENTITCSYHFGYIGEMEQKEQIPEECLLCADVVQCMHKK